MSRLGVEKACFALESPDNAAAFRADPQGFLSGYPLTADEARALTDGDIGALYRMDVLYNAIAALSRVFGYDMVTYVRRLREAAGVPEDPFQIEILQKRTTGGRS